MNVQLSDEQISWLKAALIGSESEARKQNRLSWAKNYNDLIKYLENKPETMVEVSGQEIHDGQTVSVDHFVQTFGIKIRSMSNLDPQTVKDQLQKKWEVTDIIQIGDSISYVRKGANDF